MTSTPCRVRWGAGGGVDAPTWGIGVTVHSDVRTSAFRAVASEEGRESAAWDTMDRPNVVRRHHPRGSHAPRGLVRAEGHRFNYSRSSGHLVQTHEAPTNGQPASTAEGEGSNHEVTGESMPHGHGEHIRSPGLTPTPYDVRAAGDVMTACGSPIEVAFLRAFLAEAEQMGWCATVRWTTPEGLRRSWCPVPKLEASETQCWVDVQAQLGPHRVDFAITACHASRSGGVLRYWEAAPHVVECDGHDYHSSREQRTADAERDRYLTAKGFRPVRLTGTELHRDAHLCALEVLRLVRLNPVRFTSGNASEQVTP